MNRGKRPKSPLVVKLLRRPADRDGVADELVVIMVASAAPDMIRCVADAFGGHAAAPGAPCEQESGGSCRSGKSGADQRPLRALADAAALGHCAPPIGFS
jgi:hypothetical protein